MPPRLMVGTVFGESALTVELARAGHTVRAIDAEHDPGQVQHVDLVLLDTADADDVRWAAAQLANYARPRQMFLHTVLEEGPQLLDDVETAQAIVMCAHNIFGNIWVTSAADEVGETVVGLLLSEVGGASLRILDANRRAIAAAQELRALESTVRDDALEIMDAAVPDFTAVADQFLAAPAARHRAYGPGELDQLLGALPGPGVRRLFVDLQRRRAELRQDTDIELWVIEKYEGA